MKELTLAYALENKFTPNDMVRYFDKEMTDEQCDFVLWDQTCFPFDMKGTVTQLNNLFLNVKAKPQRSEGK